MKLAQGPLELYAPAAYIATLWVFFAFDSVCRFFGKLLGSFFYTLLVIEHDSGHDQRLGFVARLCESLVNQQFVDALALHCEEEITGSSASRHRSWRIAQAEFGGTIMAKPNNDLGCIGPEE
jgi:hypothetical protein